MRSKYIWTRAFDSETRHRLQRVDVRKIIIFERKKNDRNGLRPHRDAVIWRLNDNPITIAECSNRIRIELSRTLVTFLSVLINLTSKRIINVHREFRMHTIRVYSDVQIPFAIRLANMIVINRKRGKVYESANIIAVFLKSLLTKLIVCPLIHTHARALRCTHVHKY